MKSLPRSLAAILCLLATGAALPAEPPPRREPLLEPLWEVGLFNFVASIPHYRGSDESQVYAFPAPYLIYRGERIRATREGVRGIFYQDERFETSLSLSGNPPVYDGNEARSGMPDLDALGEIGPSIKWYLLGRDPLDKLYLQASARAAASIGFESGSQIAYRGIAGNLEAVYSNRSLLRDLKVRFRILAGINFGDRGYNSYFYEVPAAYATPDRPAYSADGGYGGTTLVFSMQYDMTPRVSLGFYSRWDSVAGAVFADSPLVRQDDNFFVGAALILRLYRSNTLVATDALD